MTIQKTFVMLLLGWLYIGTANAMPITINANDYAPGTDISHAINNVLLQDYSHAAYADTLTYSAAITPSPVDYCTSTSPSPSCYYYSLQTGGNNEDIINFSSLTETADNITGLQVSSDSKFNSLSFTAMEDAGSYMMYAFLYDKNHNYISHMEFIGSDALCGSGTTPDMCFSFTESIDLSSLGVGVYSVNLGGFDATWLTSLTADVPEPSSLALLCIGLVGLSLIPLLKQTRR